MTQGREKENGEKREAEGKEVLVQIAQPQNGLRTPSCSPVLLFLFASILISAAEV
jgi:hypothetical protein